MKCLRITLGIFVLFLGQMLPTRTLAQTNDSQTITNWGESVNGVQLSIALNTNVLVVGKSSVLHCRIKNTFSDIAYLVNEPAQDMDILLISDSGKKYELVRPYDGPYAGNVPHELKSNQTIECDMPLQLDKSIEPGSYSLKALVSMESLEGGYQPVSNLLKVEVK